MTPLRSVGRVALADHVYDVLSDSLLSLAIPAEARLNIDQLARDLSVSPTPLREALARLEGENVVIKRPLAGYVAAPLMTKRALAELYDLRLHIEPWLAGLAAASGEPWPDDAASPPDAARDALVSAARADAQFHTTVAALAGNSVALVALRRLNPHFHVYRYFASHGVVPESADGHVSIAAAISAGDRAAATAAMRTHLQDSNARLQELPGE